MHEVNIKVRCEPCDASATITGVLSLEPQFIEREKRAFLQAAGCKHAEAEAREITERNLRALREGKI